MKKLPEKKVDSDGDGDGGGDGKVELLLSGLNIFISVYDIINIQMGKPRLL